jgi:alkyl hydroperoxide reductase subunit AhpF
MNAEAGPVEFELYSSSFCGACRQARAALDSAARLLQGATVSEHDVALESDRAEAHNIDATPTVIVRNADGAEVFRAVGIPTISQVLAVAARALDAAPEAPGIRADGPVPD